MTTVTVNRCTSKDSLYKGSLRSRFRNQMTTTTFSCTNGNVPTGTSGLARRRYRPLLAHTRQHEKFKRIDFSSNGMANLEGADSLRTLFSTPPSLSSQSCLFACQSLDGRGEFGSLGGCRREKDVDEGSLAQSLDHSSKKTLQGSILGP